MAARNAVIQVTLKGRLHGSETNNVLHFDTATNPVNIMALLLAVAACIVNNLKPAISDEFVFEKLVGRQIWPTIGDEVEYVPTTEIRGTGLPALPSFNAALVRLNTGGGGRSGKGRFFLAGVVANDVSQSKLTSSGFGKYANFIACLVAAFIAAADPVVRRDYEIGVLSRKNSGVNFATAGAAFRPVTSISMSNIVATMHSRKLGVGS